MKCQEQGNGPRNPENKGMELRFSEQDGGTWKPSGNQGEAGHR